MPVETPWKRDVFESVYRPGIFAHLVDVPSSDAGVAFGRKLFADSTTEYFRVFEVMRDYGMFNRGEAPQYYPPLPRATMKRVIKTAAAAAMYNPVSQATVGAGGMLYTAGMVGRSPVTGEMLPSFDEQAHQALRNLGAILQQAGGSYKDVMFLQLYLLDMGTIEQFNEIFKAHFLSRGAASACSLPAACFTRERLSCLPRLRAWPDPS